MPKTKLISRTTTIIGLNPALQKRFLLSQEQQELVPGNVHRASAVLEGVGGKGQDVAICLSALGCSESHIQLVQFVGKGYEGETFSKLLLQKLGEGKDDDISDNNSTTTTNHPLWIQISGKTRICTTVVGANGATELVEPSAHISARELDLLFSRLSEQYDSNPAQSIVIMGSMPPGCPSDSYSKILQLIASDETLVVVDSVVGLDSIIDVLAHIQCKQRAILKLNLSEFCRLAKVTKSSKEECGKAAATQEAVERAVHGILKVYGASKFSASFGHICITDGGHDAYFIEFPDVARRNYSISVVPTPSLRSCKLQLHRSSDDKDDTIRRLYPIGGGDAVAGGMIFLWNHLKSIACGDSTPCCTTDLQPPLDRIQSIIDNFPADRKEYDGFSWSCKDKLIELAFIFGLACGSASCLVEGNSEFLIEDVLDLFENSEASDLVSATGGLKLAPHRYSPKY